MTLASASRRVRRHDRRRCRCAHHRTFLPRGAPGRGDPRTGFRPPSAPQAGCRREAFNRGLLRRAGLAQCETVATVMPDLSGHPAAPKAHNRKIGRHGQRSRFTLTVANIRRFGVLAVKEPDLGSVEPDHHRGPHRTRLRRLVGMHPQLRPGPRSPRRRQHHHLPHARDHLPRAPVAAAAPAGNASPAHGMVPQRRG